MKVQLSKKVSVVPESLGFDISDPDHNYSLSLKAPLGTNGFAMLVDAKGVNHVHRLPALSSSVSKPLESESPHHDPTLSERPKRHVLRVMHIWHLSSIVFEKSDPLISCAPLLG